MTPIPTLTIRENSKRDMLPFWSEIKTDCHSGQISRSKPFQVNTKKVIPLKAYFCNQKLANMTASVLAFALSIQMVQCTLNGFKEVRSIPIGTWTEQSIPPALNTPTTCGMQCQMKVADCSGFLFENNICTVGKVFELTPQLTLGSIDGVELGAEATVFASNDGIDGKSMR